LKTILSAQVLATKQISLKALTVQLEFVPLFTSSRIHVFCWAYAGFGICAGAFGCDREDGAGARRHARPGAFSDAGHRPADGDYFGGAVEGRAKQGQRRNCADEEVR